MDNALLRVKDLRTSFRTPSGPVTAVDNISFSVGRGESLGIVGESGCGKSVTALSIMRLIPDPPGRIESGKIFFQGENLLEKSDDNMRAIRGNEIAMIFQEPMTSLNPVFTVGAQVAEAIELHQHVRPKEALQKTIELFRQVGIPDPQKRVHDYPHQLSGGMRQRVMIAMALSCHPKLLIADEPTTAALDVTIQAQILDLIRTLQRDLGMAVMLITHDLGVIAQMAERVIIVYAGVVIEESSVRSLFRKPLHPYTQGLLHSMPDLAKNTRYLHTIEGVVPRPGQMPQGCRFHPRCPYATAICRHAAPEIRQMGPGRLVRCHHPLVEPLVAAKRAAAV